MIKYFIYLFFVCSINLVDGIDLKAEIKDPNINYVDSLKIIKTPVASPFRFSVLPNYQIVEDSNNIYDIDYVSSDWDQLSPKSDMSIKPEVEKSYWLRAIIRGSKNKHNHLFQIATHNGEHVLAFSHIEAYNKVEHKEWRVQKLGAKIPMKDRPIHFWANLIEMDIPNQTVDTLYVKLFMTSEDEKYLPSYIGINLVERASIWPKQVYDGVKHSFFYAILFFQCLYLLFLYIMEREKLHLFLFILVLGSLIGIAFTLDNFKEFAIFPSWRTYHDGLSFVGIFLVIYGIIKFTKSYFQYPRSSILSRYIIPIFLAGSSLFMFVSYKTRALENENPLPLVILLVAGAISFYIALVSKSSAGRFRTFYLTAFIPPLLVIFTMMVFTFNFSWLPDYNFYSFFDILKGSFLVTLSALALSTGYRAKKIKEEKEDELKNNLESQRIINKAISKFVPNEFISALGKNSITDVSLGDNTEREVTVLFSDIRGYTSMSEKLSPEENFTFVSEYSALIGPIIRNNDGFINQYLGDGIMALFVGKPDDALQASLQMKAALHSYNQERAAKNEALIKVGIGMHTGLLIMGILGDQDRYDAATISDTVNTAARLEGLTKQFPSSIIFSAECLDKMEDPPRNQIISLGEVTVKGKTKKMAIYGLKG